MNVAPWKRRLAGTPIIGPCVLFVYRAKKAFRYYWKPLRQIVVWLFRSREMDNFTMNLDPRNRRHLSSLIAHLAGCLPEQVMTWFDELEQDHLLRKHIAEATLSNPEGIFADTEARYGRRLGWYAFVRALKPQIVIETGVEKGLGSLVIAAALMRNAEEGMPGSHYGLDIDPVAGWLLAGPYATHNKILYGDSIETLKTFEQKIDLLINDSDHSCTYERDEYKTIQDKLSPHAVILGDNAHCCDSLIDFAIMTGRQFVFFQEKTDDWYPGGGIGVAFSSDGIRRFQ